MININFWEFILLSVHIETGVTQVRYLFGIRPRDLGIGIMSYQPPPGLNTSQLQSSTSQPHPSLPARPSSSFKPAFSAAPSANNAPGTRNYGNSDASISRSAGFGSFAAFEPRSVAGGNQGWQGQTPTWSSGPTLPFNFTTSQLDYSSGGYQQNQYSNQPQLYSQSQGPDSFAQPTPPQIRNPFPLPGQDQSGHGRPGAAGRDGFSNVGYDPEMEAQIAQWQSAYAARDDVSGGKGSGLPGPSSAGGANAVALGIRGTTSIPLSNQEVASAAKPDTGVAAVVHGTDGKQKTVVRSGGGQTWQDASLLEWDPAHFRLFIGNLAGEVTDESLLKAFSKYESVQKARVVRDKTTTKSKGYGFVSFSNGDQYFQAAKDMQGKYIGSHPVLLRRSTTEIRPTHPTDKKKTGKGGKGKGGGNNGTNTGAGVQKKQSKTKGGLKIIG